MRRRWLLILGGVVALGVITVFALALFFPRAPFRFLDGQAAMHSEAFSTESQSADYYSFKADFKDVLNRAKAELLTLGFEEIGQVPRPSGVTFVGPSPLDEVVLFENTRMRGVSLADMMRWNGKDLGWVTVGVGAPRTLTLWDRVKAVFGL